MGKALIAFISLAVGLVAGAFGALSLGGGAMMGAGVGTGLATGICATASSAQDLGFLTADQVDQVLANAASQVTGPATASSATPRVGSAAACKEFLAKLNAGT